MTTQGSKAIVMYSDTNYSMESYPHDMNCASWLLTMQALSTETMETLANIIPMAFHILTGFHDMQLYTHYTARQLLLHCPYGKACS